MRDYMIILNVQDVDDSAGDPMLWNWASVAPCVVVPFGCAGVRDYNKVTFDDALLVDRYTNNYLQSIYDLIGEK
jgi:hypothetical protein